MSDLSDEQWRQFAVLRRERGSDEAHRFAQAIRAQVFAKARTWDVGRPSRGDAAFGALTQSVMRTVVVWAWTWLLCGAPIAYAMALIMMAVGGAQVVYAYLTRRVG